MQTLRQGEDLTPCGQSRRDMLSAPSLRFLFDAQTKKLFKEFDRQIQLHYPKPKELKPPKATPKSKPKKNGLKQGARGTKKVGKKKEKTVAKKNTTKK